MNEFRPVNDYITVIPDEREETTLGGIYIPDGHEKPDSTGVVVGVGGGTIDRETKERRVMEVSPGDRVLFGRAVDYEIKVDGERQLIMKDTNVLAIRKDL